MAKLSGVDTKPEIFVRKFLFANGLRYRKNIKELPGRPDIVLTKYRTVIFVHGCFWHGHEDCEKSALSATNGIFWKQKISKNITSDIKNIEALENEWNVIVVWQCELKNKEKSSKLLAQLLELTKTNF